MSSKRLQRTVDLVCGRSLVFGLALAVGGCHSAFVNASVINHTGAPIRLLEVDYPSASFGTQDLPNGAEFRYRFKILGGGETRLSWTDVLEKDHVSTGPALTEGEEGKLSITVGPERAVWLTDLHR
jgi:hypothetical protein